jgi:hypothetical protein
MLHCNADGDDGDEVLFVSAGGLVSRILVSAITTQSRTAKGIAMLNLQVCFLCQGDVACNRTLATEGAVADQRW